MTSGWDFFGIGIFFWARSEKSRKPRNPGDRDRDLKIPRKSGEKNSENPDIPGIGIGILKPLKNPETQNPEKYRVQNLENPEIPGIMIEIWKSGKKFFDFRDFSGFSENHRDFRQILGIRDFCSLGIFFSLGIFIPGIRDFFSLGIFIPGLRNFS